MSQASTVLVTGCSSGFGLDIARHFLAQGWRVVATMRTPREDLLPASERLRVLPLDITDADSIARCLAAAGPIDALVNNAGVGLLAPLEGTNPASVREVFETNVLGTIAMTQAVLPQFRERRAGVIVNVTSTVTLRPLPLLAVYTGSKAAINAFTESLALELAPFEVRVRLVLPGRAPHHALRRQCAPPDGRRRAGAVCGVSRSRVRLGARHQHADHAGERRGRGGLARGDRSGRADADPRRRRCGGGGSRGQPLRLAAAAPAWKGRRGGPHIIFPPACCPSRTSDRASQIANLRPVIRSLSVHSPPASASSIAQGSTPSSGW